MAEKVNRARVYLAGRLHTKKKRVLDTFKVYSECLLLICTYVTDNFLLQMLMSYSAISETLSHLQFQFSKWISISFIVS